MTIPSTAPVSVAAPAPAPVAAPKPASVATPQPTQPAKSPYPARLDALWQLMVANGVTDEELRTAVATQGYYPFECKVEDYPQGFCDWLPTVWDSFMKLVGELRDVPFEAHE